MGIRTANGDKPTTTSTLRPVVSSAVTRGKLRAGSASGSLDWESPSTLERRSAELWARSPLRGSHARLLSIATRLKLRGLALP